MTALLTPTGFHDSFLALMGHSSCFSDSLSTPPTPQFDREILSGSGYWISASFSLAGSLPKWFLMTLVWSV